MITLDDYLVTTRGYRGFPLDESRFAPLHATYRKLFDYFCAEIPKMIQKEISAPQFKIVYTVRARTEIVTLPDRDYIVYDQYNGQIIGKLNRLLLEERGLERLDAYLFKLVAIRIFDQGDTEGALASAMLHAVSSARLPPVRQQAPTLDTYARWMQTLMNEAFAIAHEMCHYLWRGPPLIRAAMRDFCVPPAVIGARLRDLDQQDVDVAALVEEGYNRDYRAAAERAVAGATWSSDEEKERFLRGSGQRQEPRDFVHVSHAERVAEFIEDPHLLEEFVCDSLAAELVDRWSAKESEPAALLDSFPMSLAALHHLRLLRTLDALAFGRELDERHLLRETRESQARISLLRLFGGGSLFLRQVNASDPGGEYPLDRMEGERRRLNGLFTSMNETYAENINDHVLFFFLRHARSAMSRIRDEGLIDGDAVDAAGTIAALCGFVTADGG
ncbi:hypothetical protein [Herbidospora cretacea]|uniref:hypothetical protein n=1 Tax=Herbidospora cretacea TaxID=28444 RepID=UPI0007735179|nr:hypothetical protein [Herbidospora cretacea]